MHPDHADPTPKLTGASRRVATLTFPAATEDLASLLFSLDSAYGPGTRVVLRRGVLEVLTSPIAPPPDQAEPVGGQG